jgi:hypothetical protein
MITIQYVRDDDMKEYTNVSTVTMEVDDGQSTVDDLLQAFDNFIKAIGYRPEGYVEYVTEKEEFIDE